MTQNAIQILTFIFAWGWRFLTGFYIPGTNVTPGAVLFFIFLAYISLKLISRLTNDSPTPFSSDEKE